MHARGQVKIRLGSGVDAPGLDELWLHGHDQPGKGTIEFSWEPASGGDPISTDGDEAAIFCGQVSASHSCCLRAHGTPA